MNPSPSPRSFVNEQGATGPKFPDKRETVKSPVNSMDFSTLAKQTQSDSSLLEQAYGGLHKDGA